MQTNKNITEQENKKYEKQTCQVRAWIQKVEENTRH